MLFQAKSTSSKVFEYQILYSIMLIMLLHLAEDILLFFILNNGITTTDFRNLSFVGFILVFWGFFI